MNKILCIDKNSALSEKMSAYLAQNNISADFYNSTEDCISRIISGSYSLIAMNIGYYSDWVSAIITIHRQSTVPIVLISEKRNSGSAEASYTYNANNLRASKTVNREKIDFVWNGQNLAAENKSGEVNTYTYDPTGVHIANQNGNITSYLKDYHGNVVGTTTVAGTMVQEENNRMDYDAFGNQWIGDTPDPFGYCGEYYDSESGLVYLRNRYYDSASGRFITEDPIKDGLNWYSYCGCEPVMGIDPSGLVNGETEELILALLRLTENKINYENYIYDRDFGTSYAGPYYSGNNHEDQDNYYNQKLRIRSIMPRLPHDSPAMV